MIELILALAMTVPPVPPPPEAQVAAAAKLFRLVPVPKDMASRARDSAIFSASLQALQSSPNAAQYQALRERIADHVSKSARYAADVDGCIVNSIAYVYDVPTLDDIGMILKTPGGQTLWHDAVSGPVERCYRETLSEFLQYTGYSSAMRWFARTKVTGTLPAYDAATDGPGILSDKLVAFCGTATRDALIARGGRLHVRSAWAAGTRNDATFACLVQSARLAGYDLDIALDDGTTETVIMAS